MCPILDGYGVMGIFNPRTHSRVNRVSQNQLAGEVLNLVALSFALSALFSPPAGAVHNRVAACVAAGGGIFENQI